MPPFDGDQLKFVSFWEAFKTRIHSNTSVSHVDELPYLRTCLTNAAAQIIEGIELTPDGYKEAIDVLRRRYH